ncbi:MAG: alpha/beta hydrolase family protein [Polyangiales bacterium]
MRFVAFLALAAPLLACSSTKQDAAPIVDAGSEAPSGPRLVPAGNGTYEKSGPNPVGHAIFTLTDAARSRSLVVQLWYPAAASAKAAADTGTPIEDLVLDPTDHATMASLVAKAPAGCTRRKVQSAKDVDPASGTWPLILYSHCYGCTRFSSGAIAERLASHGFAVIAPDHTGNTVFDSQRGMDAPLDGTFLDVRRADMSFVLDSALAGDTLPEKLRGKLDAAKVGMFGHSFGGATTGLVLARDTRVKAGLAIGAPMENDLLPPAKMAEIHQPAMFLLAREDNSISEIGNNIIRSNFQHGNKPIWLSEVDDAGHWSFSDIAALTPKLAAGCGEGTRQTESGEPFFYLDNEGARALGASYVTSFFAATINGDASAKTFLTASHPSGVVTSSVRE